MYIEKANGFSKDLPPKIFKKKIPALINMAKNGLPSLVITDLDRTLCAPSLVRQCAGITADKPLSLPDDFFFRVAVRAIEAWIMADRKELACLCPCPCPCPIIPERTVER